MYRNEHNNLYIKRNIRKIIFDLASVVVELCYMMEILTTKICFDIYIYIYIHASWTNTANYTYIYI
jgi:hypothetical protein